MKRTTTWLAIIAAATLFACGAQDQEPLPNPNPNPEGADVLRSEKQRVTSPTVSNPDLEALVAGNSDFTFDIYPLLRAKAGDEGFFYSPFSISQALAMVYAGARGDTELQMSKALGFGLDQTKLHPAFNSVDLALASRGQGAAGKDGKGFRLNLANAVWGQRGYNILASFLDTLALNYGAGLNVLDFETAPEPSRATINKWVAVQTEDKIKELLPAGSITGDTRMVLTNTIYFNAAWSKVFPEEATTDGEFTKVDGSKVTVPMMSNMDTYRHGAGDGWQAVELPYDGEELSMLVVVPDSGRFAEVEGKLGRSWLASVDEAMSPTTLSLTLPKWEQRSKFKLKEQLKALGMVDAFAPPTANFSGINGGIEALWISEVIHEAFVGVDEKGTEAAAATAVIMVGGSMPGDALAVDRPFLFLIRDNPTGSILFVGRVMNPKS